MPGFGNPVFPGGGNFQLTYDRCVGMWENRRGPQRNLERIKLGTSTYLECIPGDIPIFKVRLHETDILRFYSGQQIALATGGWFTVTTKSRLNEFGPLGIFADRGVWSVSRKSGDGWTTLGMFQENMIVGPRGGLRRPTRLPPVAKGLAVAKRVTAMRKAYKKRIPEVASRITKMVYRDARHFRPMPVWKAICHEDVTAEFLAAMIYMALGRWGNRNNWDEFQRSCRYRSKRAVADMAFNWFTRYYQPAWIEKVVREDITLPRLEQPKKPRRLHFTKLFDLTDDEMI